MVPDVVPLTELTFTPLGSPVVENVHGAFGHMKLVWVLTVPPTDVGGTGDGAAIVSTGATVHANVCETEPAPVLSASVTVTWYGVADAALVASLPEIAPVLLSMSTPAGCPLIDHV